MAAIELDPTKTYYVNIKVLDTAEPCGFITSIIDKSSEGGEKPPGSVPTCTESNWNPNRDSVYFLGTNARTPPSSPFRFSEADQVVAVKITPVLGTQKSVNMGIVTDGEVDKIEAFVSECKGDFKNPPPFGKNKDGRCKFYLSPGGAGAVGGFYTTTSDSLDAEKPSDNKCVVDPNKDFYLNIRLKNQDTGSFACNQQTCSLSVSTGRGSSGGTSPGSPTCTAVPGTSIIYLSGNYEERPVSNPNEPNRSFFSLSTNQPIVATSVRRQRSASSPRLSADIVQNGNLPVYDICLSECPGSFQIPPDNENNPGNCKLTGVSTPSVTLRWATQNAQFNECKVRADKPLFINVKMIECPDGNCGLSVGTG